MNCEVELLLQAVRDVVEFVLARPDDARAQGDGFPKISDSRFSVVTTGQPRTLRRTWLDTFDWRLFRAGLSLEYTAARGTSELVLTARDGELIAEESVSAAGRRPRWPARIGHFIVVDKYDGIRSTFQRAIEGSVSGE